MSSQKSRFIEFADGGPGARITNSDVCYGFIECARIMNQGSPIK